MRWGPFDFMEYVKLIPFSRALVARWPKSSSEKSYLDQIEIKELNICALNSVKSWGDLKDWMYFLESKDSDTLDPEMALRFVSGMSRTTFRGVGARSGTRPFGWFARVWGSAVPGRITFPTEWDTLTFRGTESRRDDLAFKPARFKGKFCTPSLLESWSGARILDSWTSFDCVDSSEPPICRGLPESAAKVAREAARGIEAGGKKRSLAEFVDMKLFRKGSSWKVKNRKYWLLYAVVEDEQEELVLV